MDDHEVTEITRTAVVDMLLLREERFHGRLDLLDFLARVWPLHEMPSEDRRFVNAFDDIATHMGFGDWDESYLLLTRLGLATGLDSTFFRFLETCVHPLVVRDEQEASQLASNINRLLSKDGFLLTAESVVSGRSIYSTSRSGAVRRGPPEPTGWELVDRQLGAMRTTLMSATTEEEFQSVGLLGRELMISVGQMIIDPTTITTLDGRVVSRTDAARMLDAFIGQVLPGSGNEELRRAAKAVVAATNAVVHNRSANRRDAALCLELVTSSVNIAHLLHRGDAG